MSDVYVSDVCTGTNQQNIPEDLVICLAKSRHSRVRFSVLEMEKVIDG